MRQVRVWTGCVLGALVAGSVWGCGGGGRVASPNAGLETMTRSAQAKPRPALRPPPHKPAPAGPADRSDLAELIRQQAIDTQKILDGEPAAVAASPRADTAVGAGAAGSAGGTPSGPGTGAPRQTAHAGPASQPPAASAAAPAGVGSAPAPAVPPVLAGAPAPALTINQRVEEAAGRLSEVLQEQAGTGGSMRPRAALAAIDALKLRPVSSPPLSDTLTPVQRQALDGFREAIAAFAASAEADWAASDGDEATRLAEHLNSLADRLTAGRGLSIGQLLLCTRVRGFGQYATFAEGEGASNRFVAGQPQRALVYVELERFGHRAIDDSDSDLAAARDRGEKWVVDLTQEINLYSEQGNLLVHRRPPERVVEASRTRRRDFYLVTDFTLPGTLGVGVYHLKVTVRDRATGAVAERSIPIELVADTALARGASK